MPSPPSFRRFLLPSLLASIPLLPLAHPLAAQPTVTSVAAVNALSNQQAAAALPVTLEATVTFPRPAQKNLFVMDPADSSGHGCYVRWPKEQGLRPGDRIRVTGTTAPSFRPVVVARTVTLLGHGTLPAAPTANFADLIQAKWDSRRVSITGRILSAALDNTLPIPTLRLRVHMRGGNIGAILTHPGPFTAPGLRDLLDAQVRLTGVAGGEFDSKMEMAGVFLNIYDTSGLTLLRLPAASAWALPATPIDQVISHYRFGNLSQRVRLLGTLTYYEPGYLAILEQAGNDQQPARSILIKTSSILPLHTGAAVEATGFPSVPDETLRLESAQLRPAAPQPPLAPQAIQWDAASIGLHAFSLISMEGTVVASVHDSLADLLILNSGGHLFSATLRHSSSDLNGAGASLPHPSERLALGSRIRVTGVCFLEGANPWHDRFWFDLRLRSPADITLLEPPSWWTVQHLFFIATLLGVTLLISALWAGRLERRLREKTYALARRRHEELLHQRARAALEQQRSRILELISSAEPLPQVLAEIEATVASRLPGAQAWFTLAPGAPEHPGAGLHPHPTARKRLETAAQISRQLHAPDGASLGMLTVRLDPTAETDSTANTEDDIQAALSIGARLAELAIETRRLYADLRRRSEYDLLTDIPNRFALERRLNELIDRPGSQPFGVVYIDLDRFKQINDRHGHRIGDLYLQAVTGRIQQQLRATDFFARIGGDEFIVLIPTLGSRTSPANGAAVMPPNPLSAAEEILHRIERCFHDPFQLESHTLRGSASLGLSIYPCDGLTAEALQRHADSAMYHHKESRRLHESIAISS